MGFFKFGGFSDSPMAPARAVVTVTPSTDALAVVLKGLRVTGAGTVTIRTVDNQVDVVHPVLDGERIDAYITHVIAIAGVTGLIGYA